MIDDDANDINMFTIRLTDRHLLFREDFSVSSGIIIKFIINSIIINALASPNITPLITYNI